MPAPAQAPRHAVAYPRLNEDVGGIFRVVAQLASEPPHHIADHSAFAGPFRSPDPLQQLVVGQHPPGAADPAVRRLPEAASQPVEVVKIQSSVQWFKFLPQVLHELGNPFLGFWVPPHVQDKLLAGAAPLNIGVLIVATPEM